MHQRFGVPCVEAHGGPPVGLPARFVLLALGKLGGKEMSYQSDLDLILVYEGDGRTAPPAGSSKWDRFELTDNFHFFTELMQRIIKVLGVLGPLGRLYHVDMRLRPTGKSGSLVIPLTAFHRYYDGGGAQLWERQTLTRARVVYGDAEFSREVMAAVEQAAFGLPWSHAVADEIAGMRERMEGGRSDRDVKRGFGGIVDVEFLVQLFQLKYGKTKPTVRTGNTWEALDALHADGLIQTDENAVLTASYDFLRLVESRLRIVHNRSLDELPESPDDLEKLARRLGFPQPSPLGEPIPSTEHAGTDLLAELDRHTTQTRELFLKLLQRERG